MFRPQPMQNQRPRQDKRQPTLQETMFQYMAQNDQRLKQVESQLTSIQSLLLQRGTFPLQPKPNPKKEGANVVKGRNNSYNQ